ncbi:MAG: hypothetical protein ACR2OJ_12420 [Hyphomicrobiales bacterium]
MKITRILPLNNILSWVSLFLVAWPTKAWAHASEQIFIALLPTDIYISAGVIAVVLTVLALAFVPGRVQRRLWKSRTWFTPEIHCVDKIVSLASFFFFAWLIWLGFEGPRDPLANLLPLTIWTLWWIVLFVFQAVFGDIWRGLNPWSGVVWLARGALGVEPAARLPQWLGAWPGIIAFICFGVFALADIAPEDPARLAKFVGGYWFYTFMCMLVFGEEIWAKRGECFTMILRAFAKLSAFGKGQIGVPGWQLVGASNMSVTIGIFVLCILAIGSFDGLNETFWWLSIWGINPLAFPGRSAVAGYTVFGLLVSCIALCICFAVCVYLGVRLASEPARFRTVFSQLCMSILPIALGYHIAHFLTAFLVNGQYAIAALSDPFAQGDDYLGISPFYVTTGFFNTRDMVEVIWLAQAGAVVLGHMLSILVAHGIALRIFETDRKALLSQIPIAIFMIAYTLFGLWLLAAPRGA